MIQYCIPTYKSFDECRQGVLAALHSSLVPDKIIIIDNSGNGSGTKALNDLTLIYDNVHIWPQVYNLGVAESWNTFFTQLQRDYIIVANDDVSVHYNTIEMLVTAAKNNPEEIVFAGDGSSGNAFSLFLLTMRGFTTVGAFDKKFYPAYYEDNDFARRMWLLGFKIFFVQGATYDHVGSSTLKKYTPEEMNNHHNAFRRNTEYYKIKWGDLPGKELYEVEFNGLV